MPRRRIQVVTSEQGWLHRLFHRTSMRARTAGAVAADRSGSSRDWLYPVARDDEVKSLLVAAHPDLDADEVEWRPVHPRAWRRLAVRWLVVISWVALLAVAMRPMTALATVPLAVAGVWVSRRRARSIRWGLTPTAVWYCHGWIGRHLRVVRFAKIQAVSLTETPFDRRHRMATIAVDTANAGPGGAAVRIPFLDRAVAERLRERLGREASFTTFQW
jgi:putative membrane protein